jgi:hypothetical protein
MMCMLDRFSGYNQVPISDEDRYKIAFTTPWGTYAYVRMPFGLMNMEPLSNMLWTLLSLIFCTNSL